MSNESWMENTKNWMDFLKVRASWGQNGNENLERTNTPPHTRSVI